MSIILRPSEPPPRPQPTDGEWRPSPPLPAPPGRVRVDVTADDIANGRMCNSCYCPVATALSRALNTFCAVLYGKWSTLNRDLRGAIPPDVDARINLYDRTGNMEPFSFEVDV